MSLANQLDLEVQTICAELPEITHDIEAVKLLYAFDYSAPFHILDEDHQKSRVATFDDPRGLYKSIVMRKRPKIIVCQDEFNIAILFRYFDDANPQILAYVKYPLSQKIEA